MGCGLFLESSEDLPPPSSISSSLLQPFLWKLPKASLFPSYVLRLQPLGLELLRIPSATLNSHWVESCLLGTRDFVSFCLFSPDPVASMLTINHYSLIFVFDTMLREKSIGQTVILLVLCQIGNILFFSFLFLINSVLIWTLKTGHMTTLWQSIILRF